MRAGGIAETDLDLARFSRGLFVNRCNQEDRLGDPQTAELLGQVPRRCQVPGDGHKFGANPLEALGKLRRASRPEGLPAQLDIETVKLRLS